MGSSLRDLGGRSSVALQQGPKKSTFIVSSSAVLGSSATATLPSVPTARLSPYSASSASTSSSIKQKTRASTHVVLTNTRTMLDSLMHQALIAGKTIDSDRAAGTISVRSHHSGQVTSATRPATGPRSLGALTVRELPSCRRCRLRSFPLVPLEPAFSGFSRAAFFLVDAGVSLSRNSRSAGLFFGAEMHATSSLRSPLPACASPHHDARSRVAARLQDV